MSSLRRALKQSLLDDGIRPEEAASNVDARPPTVPSAELEPPRSDACIAHREPEEVFSDVDEIGKCIANGDPTRIDDW